MVSKTIFTIMGLFALLNGEATASATTREPSLQAYGLPKRFLENNGYIERINLGNAVNKIEVRPGDPRGTPKKSTVKHGSGIDAALEMFHLDSNLDNSRNRRAIDVGKDDLQAEESKVFRPLFVYRQQVARRQRNQREKSVAKNTKPRYPKNNKNSLYYYPQSG